MEYVRENDLFVLENAESGLVFKNKSPLDHHDLKHYVHRDWLLVHFSLQFDNL